MKAFVNSKISKAQLIASLKAHQLADRFIQGRYWNEKKNKGCHLGCSVHDFEKGSEEDHNSYPRLFKLSKRLAYLSDKLFEGLSTKKSKTFSIQLTESIPIGCDTDKVIDKFLHWLLSGDDSPIANWNKKECIKTVANLYKRKLEGKKITIGEWKKASSAADAAAAAYAAADAADDAADDDAAAAYAAYAAASDAADDDAAAASDAASDAAAAYASDAAAAYAAAAADAADAAYAADAASDAAAAAAAAYAAAAYAAASDAAAAYAAAAADAAYAAAAAAAAASDAAAAYAAAAAAAAYAADAADAAASDAAAAYAAAYKKMSNKLIAIFKGE